MAVYNFHDARLAQEQQKFDLRPVHKNRCSGNRRDAYVGLGGVCPAGISSQLRFYELQTHQFRIPEKIGRAICRCFHRAALLLLRTLLPQDVQSRDSVGVQSDCTRLCRTIARRRCRPKVFRKIGMSY